jgi:hypothetical protein
MNKYKNAAYNDQRRHNNHMVCYLASLLQGAYFNAGYVLYLTPIICSMQCTT